LPYGITTLFERLNMSPMRRNVSWGVFLLGGVLAVLSAAPAAVAQGKPAEAVSGRYKILDFPVGKFVYRLQFDSATGDFWLWVNGEWEAPEPPMGGVPWKDVQATPGRFQLLPQIQGELDAELYVFDSATGRMWSRPARNRIELTAAAEWREIPPPSRPKR
jgi:hypothetical protein